MSKTSPTAAGPTETANESLNDRVDAINQVFSLLRINFHNQYYKALPDDATLKLAKKLWLEGLSKYSTKNILLAANKIIEEQEYLPTLHQMLAMCAQEKFAAPEPHQAYVEACNAPSPKASQNWSHPAVYEAGRRSDWFFLATTAEQFALPVFRGHYEKVLSEFGQGIQIELPAASSETKPKEEKINKQDGLVRVKALRSELGL